MTDHCTTDFCIWRTICLAPVRCISSIRHMYTTDFAYDRPIFLVPLSLSYPSSPVVWFSIYKASGMPGRHLDIQTLKNHTSEYPIFLWDIISKSVNLKQIIKYFHLNMIYMTSHKRTVFSIQIHAYGCFLDLLWSPLVKGQPIILQIQISIISRLTTSE